MLASTHCSLCYQHSSAVGQFVFRQKSIHSFITHYTHIWLLVSKNQSLVQYNKLWEPFECDWKNFFFTQKSRVSMKVTFELNESCSRDNEYSCDATAAGTCSALISSVCCARTSIIFVLCYFLTNTQHTASLIHEENENSFNFCDCFDFCDLTNAFFYTAVVYTCTTLA